MNIINIMRYYSNIITSSFIRTKVIKYDTHTYSEYFKKERKYANSVVHTCDATNEYIAKCIDSNKAFMVARYGATELYTMEVFDLKLDFKYRKTIDRLCNLSGFFPSDTFAVDKFKDCLIDASKEVDVIAIWNLYMEEHYIKKYMKNTYLTQLRFLEPWFSTVPWTRALKGKKVLVIHPFTDTIRKQYSRREYLFDNSQILPEFELYVLKAVQTIAGEKDDRFKDWFAALNWMYMEAMKIDFDIALIGCGAYGMPLAAMLKKEGKQAIHMGGVLQILFGIKGSRWNDDPVVSKLYNEYWVYPNENETPEKATSVEDGCYW